MMIRYLLLLTTLLFLYACQDEQQAASDNPSHTPSAASVQTADATQPHDGKPLHEEKCAGCHMVKHDASLYQRTDRKVDSYERLQSQVRLCNTNLGLQLFDEDMTLIGEYLNQAYYKFPVN